MVKSYPLSILLLLLCAAASTVSHAQENSGKAAYTRVCQVCHGSEGRGDAGPSLVPLDKEFDEVLAIVREGVAYDGLKISVAAVRNLRAS